MNDARISELMNLAANGAVVRPDLVERARAVRDDSGGRARNRRLVFSLVATGAAAIAILTLAPMAAQARTIAQFETALRDVGTMQVQSLYYREGSPEPAVIQLFYSKGLWRMDRRIAGRPQSLLAKGDRLYRWEPEQGYVTVLPLDKALWPVGNGTALDFVKQKLDQDSESVKFSYVDNPPVDGRPTYKLVGKRSDVVSEIVVDRSTNLPLFSTTVQKFGASGTARARETYTFNQPITASKFLPYDGIDVPIRDLPAERAALKKAWRKPLTVMGNGPSTFEIREVSIREDGTVFMAYTGAEGMASPTDLEDENQTVYLRIGNFKPAQVMDIAEAVQREMRFGAHEVFAAAWVPLEPTEAKEPRRLTVGSRSPAFSELGAEYSAPKTGPTATVFAEPIESEIPAWADSLMMEDVFKRILPREAAQARGDYYRSKGLYVKAADQYEAAYQAALKLSRRRAYLRLVPAVECLELAGEKVRAVELKRLLLRGKSFDEFLSVGERQKAAEELKALSGSAK